MKRFAWKYSRDSQKTNAENGNSGEGSARGNGEGERAERAERESNHVSIVVAPFDHRRNKELAFTPAADKSNH